MHLLYLCGLTLSLLTPTSTFLVLPDADTEQTAPTHAASHIQTDKPGERVSSSKAVEAEEGSGSSASPLPSSADYPTVRAADAPQVSRGNGQDSQDAEDTFSDEDESDDGRPRAIVDIRREGVGGEVSYIIHPDNQPPPSYKPLKDLPPPTRPVAKWRPDIFMKICCSDPEANATAEYFIETSNNTQNALVSPVDETTTNTLPQQTTYGIITETMPEGNITTAVSQVEGGSHDSPNAKSDMVNNLALNSSEAAHPDAASNHTPRYEEANPYQDMANFLRDIANSEGFQNGFLGDLINNFGSLDQNALKLIYSLLIRPLEDSYRKEDRLGVVQDGPPATTEESLDHEDSVVLTRDRLPLRDRPDNGYYPLKTSFLQSRPSDESVFSIQPSVPVRPMPPLHSSDGAWRPSRIYDRPLPTNRRGEEMVDVITAPPAKTFEVVLGSSLSHSNKQHRDGSSGASPNTPSSASIPIPFDKLTLGLEMPPPEALEALPPGSVLIPPSHIMGRPNLPKILPSNNGGPPALDFLPSLPFLPKAPRNRYNLKSKGQDIPAYRPGLHSPLLPTAPAPTPSPHPALQPPRRRVESRPHLPFTLRPPAPPPIPTKRTPPAVPTVSLRRPHQLPASSSLFPYLSPPPPPPLMPLPPPSDTVIQEHNFPLTQENFEFSDRVDDSFSSSVFEGIPDYVVDRKEDHHNRPKTVKPEGPHHHHPPHEDYYSDIYSDYLDSYYDLHYEEYYEDDSENIQEQEPPTGDSSTLEQRPFIHEASATFHAGKTEVPSTLAPVGTTHPSLMHHVMGGGQSDDHFPAGTDGPLVHYPNLDDLLGVVKPNISLPIGNIQENNDTQSFLHNHRPSASPPREDSGVSITAEQSGNITAHPIPKNEENTSPMLEKLWINLESHTAPEERGRTGNKEEEENVERASTPFDVNHREHDASISQLWKNIQLIPLTPDLFEPPRQHEDNDTLPLTTLFDTAVPLAPDVASDPVQDLSSDVDRIVVDHNGVQVTMTEDVLLEDPDKEEAKFMAYLLIGACCGLALLSITGVIVIVRFKKTCGSRQIKTRTRLTEQNSIENISRHVSHMTPPEEPGHKLGSWFTGRNEHIGSGKLRGNMALPAVYDHKREKKGISSSTRDLLSISSQSSPVGSPSQERRDNEAGFNTSEEEPRSSWLHGEYRASEDELGHTFPGRDTLYRLQQQGAAAIHRHSTDHHKHHHEVSTKADSPSRGTRERRYTGHSRDGEQPSHSTARHGPRYLASLDSEELEDGLEGRARQYQTDSDLDDGTTQYDSESRAPSRYFSDSRELDDIVNSRRPDYGASMTSQELGEHISRDLKQYQSRQEEHLHQVDEVNEPLDSGGGEASSRELESEESRELGRSHSQVSFSRDNVQNEVFLEFDSMLRQQGQYLSSEAPASTLGRVSVFTNDTRLSGSRANTPDSIDLPENFTQSGNSRREGERSPPSPPTTPPRFSPPPPPPRPPKPGHLSKTATPSPKAGRGRPPSPGQSPPSPPSSSHRPVHWTSDEERLI